MKAISAWMVNNNFIGHAWKFDIIIWFSAFKEYPNSAYNRKKYKQDQVYFSMANDLVFLYTLPILHYCLHQ